jgi:hypothetical protein
MIRMKRGGRLEGQTIMLATGIPDDSIGGDQKAPLGTWDIDQAVTALARAVFAEGGKLVVEGDPSLTLLLAMVAGEYQAQRFAEGSGPGEGDPAPSVRVYRNRSRSEREGENEDLLERFHLVDFASDMGGDMVGGFGPIERESPVALICIGGGREVMNQARRFADTAFRRPIFVLKTTGGAAAQLASDPFVAAEAIDADIAEQVWTRARTRHESTEAAFDRRRHELEQKIVPYPVIMQLIVAKIALGDTGFLEM